MRVLLVTPDFAPAVGGIQALLAGVAAHAGEVHIRVLTPEMPGDREHDARLKLDVRRVRSLPARSATIAAVNAAAVNEARRFRPAIVVSGHVVTALGAAVAARACGVPWVQYVYATEVCHFAMLSRLVMRQATQVIAVSRYSRALAVQAGALPERVTVAAPGVDLPAEPPAHRPVDPTVLTVARIDERYKGHDVIARAVPLIRARVPHATWVVLGDGALRPAVEDLASALRLGDGVRFLGSVPRSQRDAWFRRARVFAMTSRVPAGGAGEGFGIVYLEAGAHGLPVVAGAAGGAVDAVDHDVTGLLVDSTDHLAVADAVTELLLDEAKAVGYGHAGRAKAEDHAWPLAAQGHLDVLRRAVG